MKIITVNSLEKLIGILKDKRYNVIGPVVKDNAIIYDEINKISDLPAGYTDEQNAGYYRLKKRNDDSLFGYAVGPHSWKKYLFPPLLKLFSAEKNGKSFTIKENGEEIPKYAFIGVRACELKAIFIQDKVFNNNQFSDSYYNKVRKNVLLISVNCTEAGGTCFCISMNAGPKAESGFDISLTEIINEKEHYFLLETGSDTGRELVSLIETRDAEIEDEIAGEKAIDNAAKNMGRHLDTKDIKELLLNNQNHPQWNDAANRCLSCANCTMVCPTCFCSNVEDVTDLSGNNAERWRKWDSCFTLEFSKVAGGNFRSSSKARYRQWMTHKIAGWIDQFGTSGCVGCGRCISWCPVGIDITREAELIKINNKLK